MAFELAKIIKDNFVEFNSFHQNVFYYSVVYGGQRYIFPVPLDDIGTGRMLNRDRAIMYMRWIRRSLTDKTFVPDETSIG